MWRTLPIILLTGCWSSAAQFGKDDTDTTGDTDVDTEVVDDTETDTEVAWDTSEEEDTLPDDTPQLGDDDIGPTPLDGTWTGTYVYKQFLLGTLQAACFGEVTLTVDGTAFRHVSGAMPCTNWDPNFNLIPGQQFDAFGDVNGYAYGTLWTSDFSRFELQVQLTAVNFTEFDNTIRINVDGDTMTGRYDSRAVGTGHKVDIDLTRQE